MQYHVYYAYFSLFVDHSESGMPCEKQAQKTQNTAMNDVTFGTLD